jgi:hypothetical protein
MWSLVRLDTSRTIIFTFFRVYTNRIANENLNIVALISKNFFRITQYNVDAHNTHAHSPL